MYTFLFEIEEVVANNHFFNKKSQNIILKLQILKTFKDLKYDSLFFFLLIFLRLLMLFLDFSTWIETCICAIEFLAKIGFLKI